MWRYFYARKEVRVIKNQNFGIEVEMTGLTRHRAAEVIAEYFNTSFDYDGTNYDAYSVTDDQDRKWKLMSDGSINCQQKVDGRIIRAESEYSVELVSPICKYEDIEKVQEIVRLLRKAGAIVNDSVGIHIHVDALPHNAKSLRNLTNIMRSKEDILYKALQVDVERQHRFCKKVDDDFIEKLNKNKPKTNEQLKDIWYRGGDGSGQHYHNSRYHALNLHSVFQKGTVEFRLFNGTLHAGKIKSYIQLALAISNQALTQSSASSRRMTSSNEKYTFRTWLLRLGMIGKEFETARLHLLENLDGNIAWKNPEDAIKQRETIKAQRLSAVETIDTPVLQEETQENQQESLQEAESQEQQMGFGFSM